MSFSETYQSLKNRDFFFLWIGMLTLMFGMNMQMLVRSYFVYELESSGAILGIVNAGSAIPMLTLALFGGVIADRLNKKRIIQSGQLLAGCVSLVVAVLIEPLEMSIRTRCPLAISSPFLFITLFVSICPLRRIPAVHRQGQMDGFEGRVKA